MISIKVDDVKKTYPNGVQALKGVSLEIEAGEAVVMLGHNGCGKSTLFKCIAGFEKVTAGSIHVGDDDITAYGYHKMRPIRRQMGMVFQHFHLIGNISVLQNVLFGALGDIRYFIPALSPFATRVRREKVMECLARVGLQDYASHRADKLSGGQKQKVAIARMLMQEPKIVLADEPIASLDPKAGAEVMDLLWEIVREKALTLVCVLHQIEIARKYGTRTIAMNNGVVVAADHITNMDDAFLKDLYYQNKDSEDMAETLAVGDECEPGGGR